MKGDVLILKTIIKTNMDYLQTISVDDWKNILETDYSAITSIAINRDSCIDIIKSVAPQVRVAILENNRLEVKNIKDTIDQKFIDDITVLQLLKHFIARLNREVVLDYLKDRVQEKWFVEIEAAAQDKKILFAFLLTDDLDLETLKICLLLSLYERYAYQDYVLTADLETVLDPLREAEIRQFIATGIKNPKITENIVEEILQAYERSNDTKLSSKCPKVFNSGEEIIVFILRETQRSGLRTVEEYIVGTNADWIVLRFNLSLKQLKVRAVDIVKEEVYCTLANHIVSRLMPGFPVNYLKKSDGNVQSVINAVYTKLLNDSVSGVSLNEIQLKNCPFNGAPNMIIQKASNIALAETLKEEFGNLTWFSIISQSIIDRLKIRYKIKDKEKEHIFVLRFVKVDELVYVYISGQGGGIKKRQSLIRLLDSKTGVRILESKETN